MKQFVSLYSAIVIANISFITPILAETSLVINSDGSATSQAQTEKKNAPQEPQNTTPQALAKTQNTNSQILSDDLDSRIESNSEQLFNLSNKMRIIEESQEGIRSIFDSQLQKVQNAANSANAANENVNKLLDEANVKSEQLLLQMKNQNENIENIKASIAAITELLERSDKQNKEEMDKIKAELESLNAAKSTSQTNNTAILPNLQTPNLQIQNPQAKSTNSDSIQNTKQIEQTIKPNSNQDGKIPLQQSTEIKPIIPSLLEKEAQAKKDNEKQEQKIAQEEKTIELKPDQALKEGEEALKAKNYDLAQKHIKAAYDKGHRQAYAGFLLGQIAFAQKKYEEAINHYKDSATKYDKATYMPELMLNTAKSFIALKQWMNGNRFLESIVSLYPNSKEAAEAKKLLPKKK